MLIFPLKKEWYEKIRSGEKRIEYREVKPYWDKRIRSQYYFNNSPDFNKCVLSLGYTKQRLAADITDIQIIYGLHTDLHIPKNVYAIHLANVRELKQ